MGLKSTTGKLPSFAGPLTAEVPTATYSGVSDASDGNVSINPYTNQGPGVDGEGLTTSEIVTAREEAAAGFVPDPIFSVYYNNTLLGSPAVDLTKFVGVDLLPVVGIRVQAGQSASLEIATTAANQTYSPPDGFSPWETGTDGFEATDTGDNGTLTNSNRRWNYTQGATINDRQYAGAKNLNSSGAYYWEVKIIDKATDGENYASDLIFMFSNRRLGNTVSVTDAGVGVAGYADDDGCTMFYGRNHLTLSDTTRTWFDTRIDDTQQTGTFKGQSELAVNSILGFALSW